MAKSLFYIYTIFVFVHFKCISCGSERRLFNSFQMRDWDKPFVVYLARPLISDDDYSWICMGAIISETHVVTAAACLSKNVPLFVVSGYRQYVHPTEWKKHECIRRWKKKVVKICQPQPYDYSVSSAGVWSYADIGVAKIEGRFNFYDTSVRQHCDYIPQAISINYQKKYVGKGAIFETLNFSTHYSFYTYGWGHLSGLARPNDTANYNQKLLRWANLELEDPRTCLSKFGNEMHETITKTAVCARKRSYRRDPRGVAYPTSKPIRTECSSLRRANANCSYSDLDSLDEGYDDLSDDDWYDLDGNETRRSGTIEQGLCQNDHGAPLTTYVGAEEMLIGVGSTALHDDKYRCREPSIFISTYDMSLFLKCVLEDPADNMPLFYMFNGSARSQLRRRICEEHTRKEGFYIKEQVFDWSNIPEHDDGKT